jgi:hypothetical protein
MRAPGATAAAFGISILATTGVGLSLASATTAPSASSSTSATAPQPGAFRASSYINSDGGTNADVNQDSSCAAPDRYDRQRVSTKASGNPGNRNVHNDACFLDSNGNKADGPASFKSRGRGYISACPDPDGTGPKYAVLRDTNGDGRNDLCFQSGYQQSTLPGTAGDEEFHTRLNNTGRDGIQRVVWCSDADADGCGDEDVKRYITIRWTDRNSAY